MSDVISSNGHRDEPQGSDGHDALMPAPSEEPIPNPGLPEHLPRPTDVDPEIGRAHV